MPVAAGGIEYTLMIGMGSDVIGLHIWRTAIFVDLQTIRMALTGNGELNLQSPFDRGHNTCHTRKAGFF